MKRLQQKVIEDNVFVMAGTTRLRYEGVTVKGSFYCSDMEISSLKGSPICVRDNFNCSQTLIVSLEGAPSYVGKDFICSYTKVKSLHNVHKQIKHIGGTFYIPSTVESNVIGVMFIKGLRKVFFGDGTACGDNEDKQKHIEHIINKYLPDRNIHQAQEELFEAGLGEYAKI